MHRRVSALVALLTAALVANSFPAPIAAAQGAIKAEKRNSEQRKPKVDAVVVHGKSLEGNLEGNSPDRKVFVVLPLGYENSKGRRYPVLYFLHGFDARPDGIVKISEAALAQQGADGMIIVLPDGYTRHGGSMYSNSLTVGNFEDYIAKDLVAYIDARYRTIPRRESRGLAGHSMGGYGTLRIGMKHSDVFSALYAMSPCCVSPPTIRPALSTLLESMTVEEAAKANFMNRIAIASAAAWSPAPDKPPLYLDSGTSNGVADPMVQARWGANAPLAMLPQYIGPLKSMTAIALDVGDKDSLRRDDAALHESLARYGVNHTWEVFQGDHTNRFEQRFAANVVPFFAQHLQTKR